MVHVGGDRSERGVAWSAVNGCYWLTTAAVVVADAVAAAVAADLVELSHFISENLAKNI